MCMKQIEFTPNPPTHTSPFPKSREPAEEAVLWTKGSHGDAGRAKGGDSGTTAFLMGTIFFFSPHRKRAQTPAMRDTIQVSNPAFEMD